MQSLEAQPRPATRLASALNALGDFLDEPACRQCEVLRTCFTHLQEDAAALGPSSPRHLRRCLQRMVSFAYVHRRFLCRRCMPAEILSAYLTPGQEVVSRDAQNVALLSWMVGDEDTHW